MVTELKEKLTKCQQPFSNTEIKLFLERNNVALLLALSYHCDQPHELRDIRVEREKKLKKKEVFIINKDIQLYSSFSV